MTRPDSPVSHILGTPHRGWVEAGTLLHAMTSAFYGLDPAGEFYSHRVYIPAVECKALGRESFPSYPLARVEPRFGANPATAAVFDPLSLFSSFPAFFAARTLDREFTDAEIADALAAYQAAREYAAPFFSSRGILWPFSTLTV